MMSSEGASTTKKSKRELVKKWAKNWGGLRSGSPAPAATQSAPPLPQAAEATSNTPSSQHTLDSEQKKSPSSSGAEQANVGASEILTADSSGTNEALEATPSRRDVAKDYLSVTGSFLQMVLKRLPEALDPNPVKAAFSLAKMILDMKQGMDDNTSNVKNRIIATSELLLTVDAALRGWEGSSSTDEKEAMETFRREVETELKQLVKIREQSLPRRFAVQEDDQQKIAEIFDRVDEARKRLMVATTARILKIVAAFQSEFDLFLPQHLKISWKADHGYYPGGNEKGLQRSSCTAGTREDICKEIIQWATITSADGEIIYWLSGQGGAGKTTIAFTIARQLESMVTTANGSAILGGSFFCSHTEHETRYTAAIVRTIVYRLAVRSKAFRVALKECGKLDVVNAGPRAQLEGLLVEPWKKSAMGRLAEDEPCYVIPIDALDELEAEGGTEFLGALFDVVNANKGHLTGLKFLITSRSEPALVKRIEGFSNKKVCRLEEVPLQQSSADIEVYLRQNLGECATSEDIQQLVEDAAGLFIYAATAVEYVKGRSPKEQKNLLGQLLALSQPTTRRPARGATVKLDTLYLHVLETSLVDPRDLGDPEVVEQCLFVLHTFLCTFERTSTSLVSDLLDGRYGDTDLDFGLLDPDTVLHRLHAVLQIKDGQVVWFHKSFPDFIFDEKRSQRFYCNQDQHHGLLMKGCFGVMSKQLRFNIADIPTSFKLDKDIPALPQSIQTNISPALKYACQSWTGHLLLAPIQESEPLLRILSAWLQVQVLFWVEAMNLLGERKCCENMLRDAHKWVTQAKREGYGAMLHDARRWVPPSKDLSNLPFDLYEAAAFVAYFIGQDAVLSTPHLYLSSLATFPQASNLVRRWRQQFRGIPTFANARKTDSWPLLRSFPAGRWGKASPLTISPDGNYIACGEYYHASIKVHDLSTMEEVAVMDGLGDGRPSYSVAFSPEGKRLAAGTKEGLVNIWDVSSEKELISLKGHRSEVVSVAWSPDGTCVVSGSQDSSIRLWNVSAGEELKVFSLGSWNRVNCVAYSHDGSMVISSSQDRSLRVWDVATGKELRTLHGHGKEVTSIALSPHGSHMASASADSIRLWDFSTGEQLKIFEKHTGMISVAYSTNGMRIAVGCQDRTVRIWDLSTEEELKVFKANDAVNSLAFLPGGTSLVTVSDNSRAEVWDLMDRDESLVPDGHSEAVNSVACSPDGKYAVSGSYDKTVRVWDLSSAAEVKVFRGHSKSVTSVAYSPDGAYVVSGGSDHSIRIWDVSEGREIKVFEGHTDSVRSVAYLRDGKRVVSGSEDCSVRVWDVSTGEEAQVFNGHARAVTTVASSPDGRLVISGSSDQSVRIWELETGEVSNVLQGPRDFWVRSLACSPDGTQIVTASGESVVRVWDIFTGEVVKVLDTLDNYNSVSVVAFSPDGAHVVADSGKKYAFGVWDVSTGEEVVSLQGHSAGVTALAYSPDGKQILSASSDHTVRLWPASIDQFPTRYVRGREPPPLSHHYSDWLVSPTDSSANLMFVPREEHLPDDSVTFTMPRSHVAHVDFSEAKLGEDWAQCYTSVA